MPSCSMSARPRPSGWEVVDHKAVRPISGYSDEEGTLEIFRLVFQMATSQLTPDRIDIELLRISHVEVRGTYLFDLKGGPNQIQKALRFSRQQLMDETSKQGYNMFLSEGWEVTTFRKGGRRRVEVRYQARPALASGDFAAALPPPFMEMVRFVL